MLSKEIIGKILFWASSLLILLTMIASLLPKQLGGGMTMNSILFKMILGIFLLSIVLLALSTSMISPVFGNYLIYLSVFLFLIMIVIYFVMPPGAEHIKYKGSRLENYYPVEIPFFVAAAVVSVIVLGLGFYLKKKGGL